MATEQAVLNFEQPIPQNFDGETYEPQIDGVRLGKQLERVLRLMQRGKWVTLFGAQKFLESKYYPEKFPTQSISARIRDLKKEKFGAHVIEKKRRTSGTWMQRMTA